MHWRHLLLLPSFVLPVQAQTLEVLAHPNPGIFELSPRQEVVGSGARLLNHLAQVSALELRLRVVPAARSLQIVQERPGSCIAGLPRTPEREALFRWAGPLSSGALMLYGRAGEARSVASISDLRGTSIVVQRESQPLLWLHEHGLDAYEVNDTLTGLRMLNAGRVDYWLVNDVAARSAVQHSGMPAPKAMREFGRIELHLACHRDIAPDVIARLNHGLEQLRRNGELAEFGLR